MPDRRKSDRRRTFFRGRISVDKIETFEVGCTVRNLSEGGARLSLNHDELVPLTFSLAISGGTSQPGRLVWYRGGEVGVAFGESRTTNAPKPEEATSSGGSPLQARMQAIMVRRRAAGAGFTRP